MSLLANENWTRSWDGLENEVLLEQKYSEEDSINFLIHISKYFKDPRYIKIKGRPVLIVYNPSKIDYLNKTLSIWRKEIIKLGFKGIYLISQNPQNFNNLSIKKSYLS